MTESSCEICGQQARGSHFGVISCRACAAFFRRYADSKLVYANCKRLSVDTEKCFCRPCRLQKCIRMGMKTEKFQYNRDAIVPYRKPHTNIAPSVSRVTGKPEFLMFCNNLTSSPSSSKGFIDLHNLLSEASRLLNLGCQSPLVAESQLKKLTLGSKILRFDMKSLRMFEKFGKNEFMEICEYYFISVIKWIMQFDEFQKLERNMQMTLLYSFWVVWMKFQKCSTTADYRKQNPKAKPHHVIMRNMCMDQLKADKNFDTSWMSDYPFEYISVYMQSQNIHEVEIMDALVKLDPTDVEITYMFAQACFEYTGNRFRGKIQEIMDHFQQILSNDIHNYYVNDRKNTRYFHRMADLMKINNLVQKSIWDSRPQRELSKVFNVVKIEYSHPEMFEDSEFS